MTYVEGASGAQQKASRNRLSRPPAVMSDPTSIPDYNFVPKDDRVDTNPYLKPGRRVRSNRIC